MLAHYPRPRPRPVSRHSTRPFRRCCRGATPTCRRILEIRAIGGFAPGGEIGPGRRACRSANRSSRFSASVDHLFAGNLIVSLTPENTVSVEEAYGIYTAAPYGLVPKFGRFFSGLGYINEQHQHAWDFIDAPLAYQAFLGGQYANDGLQVKWVAPTDQFLELGGEVGNGDNFPGHARNKNGTGSGVVAHAGGDIGASHSWRAGLSYLQTRAQDRQYSQLDLAGNNAQVAFNGTSHVGIADFVWKYAPNGNALQTNFKLQGEYFWRRESGISPTTWTARSGLTQTRVYLGTVGWYLQGIYQFMPYWRVGARYDRLDSGTRGLTARTPRLPLDFPRLRIQQRADLDARLHAVGIQPHPAAVRTRPRRGRTRPTISSSCNTS